MTYGTPLEPVSVSLVSACRNEARHIGALLDSLLGQVTGGIDCEILIADGMSEDGTREILHDYQRKNPWITLIDNPGKIVSTGLNAAIRVARGEIILRMDAHTEYAPDYVRKCVELLRSTGAQNVGGPARTKARGLLGRAVAAAYHSPFSTGGARFHDANYEGYADTVPYGCWYKSTLQRLGMFDEALVRNQDDELNLRLIRAGGKIWQSPEIVSWYYPRATLSALFRQYFQYGFWKVPVIRKHRIPASLRHLVPGFFVLANIFFLLLLLYRLATVAPTIGFWPLQAWAFGVSLYAALCVAAAVLAARENGWSTILFLPSVFAVYHVSYGLGFLIGLAYWSIHAEMNSPRTDSLFTKISR